MGLKVIHAASIVDDQIVLADSFESSSGKVRVGDLIGLLTSFGPSQSGDGPSLTVAVKLSDAKNAKYLPMTLERFISTADYQRSFEEPVSLWALYAEQKGPVPPAPRDEVFWLYSDEIYAAVRAPRAAEREEVVLRVKALHFQAGETLKRLREQVANFEATESLSKKAPNRQAIPDDVKLLVWARDGGSCTKCGASNDLHFDHVIPLSRGGGDQAENIQLLCRTCNLSKSARLV